MIYTSEYLIAEQVKYVRLMDSHLSYINDIVAEENRTRETKKEQRRNNYKHCIHLSKNINPFKKKKMKQLKITATERSQNNIYLKIKNKLFCIKQSIHNEEPLSLNNSSQDVNRYDALNYNLQLSLQEELNAEPNDNNIFFVDQHELSTLKHNDESGIYSLFIFLDLSFNSLVSTADSLSSFSFDKNLQWITLVVINAFLTDSPQLHYHHYIVIFKLSLASLYAKLECFTLIDDFQISPTYKYHFIKIKT